MDDAANTTPRKLSTVKVGDVFGRLTVTDTEAERGPRGKRRFSCRCACGYEGTFDAYNVRNGLTKSCGCLRDELSKVRRNQLRHGMHMTRVYRIWAGMKSRCQNANHHAYADYGGRGIKVCEQWQVFENFLRDMGEPPAGASIDRTNNDGDYEPGNCAWVTPKEQNNNRRSTNTYEIAGRVMTLDEIAVERSLSVSLLKARLRRGWSIEKAIYTKKLNKWERV